MLCETCLGSNPYVRMVKLPFGNKLCKVSGLPYQGFRWKAGPHGRYKETIISYAVAKDRNICQTCLKDIQFELPVGVRDHLMAQNSSSAGLIQAPRSDAGSLYHYGHMAPEQIDSSRHYVSPVAHPVENHQMTQLARAFQASEAMNPTAFRNLPELCSFWVNGTCSRAARKSCPFRPCCGVFLFPELASSHREINATLIEKLKKDGPAVVQKNLDSSTRLAFRESQKGNRDESIKKRALGDDDVSRRYIGKLKSAVRER
jgi:pre-mRNA-splicing factor RBM22/SLT11